MSLVLKTVFSPGALRHLAAGRSFERGAAYAATGRVQRLKVGDVEASAAVRGTREYRVRLWLEGGGPAFSCTCPVGEEGLFCKHCVAVGLVLAQGDPLPVGAGSVRPRADLRSYLEGLERDRLVDLVLEQAGSDEFLWGRLLLEAAKAQGARIDLREYRRAIESVIDVGGYVDYHAMYDYSRGIEEVIDSIGELLEAGHAAEVVELCEHALACLEDALGSVDDSDGYLGGIKERLCDLHLAACVVARPDPEALAARLFEWELHSEWETFYGAAAVYADVLGERGLAVYRRLAEEVWSRVPLVGPGEEREFSTFRFNVTHIMETLAELSGDLDALVAVKARDLSSAYRFVEIAELYRKAGRHDAALVWAKRGVVAYRTTPTSACARSSPMNTTVVVATTRPWRSCGLRLPTGRPLTPTNGSEATPSAPGTGTRGERRPSDSCDRRRPEPPGTGGRPPAGGRPRIARSWSRCSSGKATWMAPGGRPSKGAAPSSSGWSLPPGGRQTTRRTLFLSTSSTWNG